MNAKLKPWEICDQLIGSSVLFLFFLFNICTHSDGVSIPCYQQECEFEQFVLITIVELMQLVV